MLEGGAAQAEARASTMITASTGPTSFAQQEQYNIQSRASSFTIYVLSSRHVAANVPGSNGSPCNSATLCLRYLQQHQRICRSPGFRLVAQQ